MPKKMLVVLIGVVIGILFAGSTILFSAKSTKETEEMGISLETVEEALISDLGEEEIVEYAKVALEEENYELAETYLDRALEINPNNYAAQFEMAKIHQAAQEFKKAEASLEKIIERENLIENPIYFYAHCLMAELFIDEVEMGGAAKIEDAKKMKRKAEELNPGHPWVEELGNRISKVQN